MPSFSSLLRWIARRKNNGGDSSSDTAAVAVEDSPISSGVECYACTQVGVPVFHSTSCDACNQPQWEASAGSSLVPIQNRPGGKQVSGVRVNSGPFGRVLDPRSKRVQVSNRALLLARGVALAIDPHSIGVEGSPCLYTDEGMAAMVRVARTCVDAMHLLHV